MDSTLEEGPGASEVGEDERRPRAARATLRGDILMEVLTQVRVETGGHMIAWGSGGEGNKNLKDKPDTQPYFTRKRKW